MFAWLTARGPAAPTRAQVSMNIDPAALAAALAAAAPPLVIDVRTPGEYAEGHIPDARLIPLAQLPARVGELSRDRPIVCVCHSGSRSSAATRHLRAAGYAARNMVGGMIAWPGPVVRGRAQ